MENTLITVVWAVVGNVFDTDFRERIMKITNRVLLSIGFVLTSLSASADELVNCLTGEIEGTGDPLTRAFYVDFYPGFTLDQIYLFFNVNTQGQGIYELTARSNTFDGDVIGRAVASYDFSGNGVPVPIIFDFNRAPVANGQRVTFDIEQLAGPITRFNVQTPVEGDGTCPLVETISSAPPLSSDADNRVGVDAIITGSSQPLVASSALLENPSDGGDVSGVATISGWVCDAVRVEVEIDGAIMAETAYGTPRGDTIGECGDADNGFGLLVNWGIFGDGLHTIRLLADGIEVDSAVFNVTTLGGAFIPGLSGQYNLPGFPNAGQQVTVEWVQSQQGFVITDFQP